MQKHQNALHQWLAQTLKSKNFQIAPLKGDASFRAFFRIKINELSYILMVIPQTTENMAAFLKVAAKLQQAGIKSPTIHAINHSQGFCLVEDFGDDLLLQKLTAASVDKYYTHAMQELLQMQRTDTSDLPAFDVNYMLSEQLLCLEWFLKTHLQLKFTPTEENFLISNFTELAKTINQQPSLFIHRDYHSRNIMLLPQGLGIIDFQDAMIGPFTYDLVSLLKDCYIRWPREKLLQWVEYYYQQLPYHHGFSLAEFLYAFDLCGIQRHLKVLGVFTRLHWKYQKSSFLGDLPMVYSYLIDQLAQTPQFGALHQFLVERVSEKFLQTCAA